MITRNQLKRKYSEDSGVSSMSTKSSGGKASKGCRNNNNNNNKKCVPVKVANNVAIAEDFKISINTAKGRKINGKPLVITAEENESSEEESDVDPMLEFDMKSIGINNEKCQDILDYEFVEDTLLISPVLSPETPKREKQQWVELPDAIVDIVSITASDEIFREAELESYETTKMELRQKKLGPQIVRTMPPLFRKSKIEDDLLSLHPRDDLSEIDIPDTTSLSYLTRFSDIPPVPTIHTDDLFLQPPPVPETITKSPQTSPISMEKNQSSTEAPKSESAQLASQPMTEPESAPTIPAAEAADVMRPKSQHKRITILQDERIPVKTDDHVKEQLPQPPNPVHHQSNPVPTNRLFKIPKKSHLDTEMAHSLPPTRPNLSNGHETIRNTFQSDNTRSQGMPPNGLRGQRIARNPTPPRQDIPSIPVWESPPKILLNDSPYLPSRSSNGMESKHTPHLCQFNTQLRSPPSIDFPEFCAFGKACKKVACSYTHELSISNMVSQNHAKQRAFWNSIVSGNRSNINDALKCLPKALVLSGNEELLFDMIPDIIKLEEEIVGTATQHVLTIISAMQESNKNSFDSYLFRILMKFMNSAEVNTLIMEIIFEQENIFEHRMLLESLLDNIKRLQVTINVKLVEKLIVQALTNTESVHDLKRVVSIIKSEIVLLGDVDLTLIGSLAHKLKECETGELWTDPSFARIDNTPHSSNILANGDILSKGESSTVETFNSRPPVQPQHLKIRMDQMQTLERFMKAERYQDAYRYFITVQADGSGEQSKELSNLIKRIIDGLHQCAKVDPYYLTVCKNFVLYLRDNGFDIYALQSDGQWNTFDYFNLYIDHQLTDWLNGRGDIFKDFHEFISEFYAELHIGLIRVILMVIYQKSQDITSLVKIIEHFHAFYYHNDNHGAIYFNDGMTIVEIQMVTHVYFYKLLKKGVQPSKISLNCMQSVETVKLSPKYKYRTWDKLMPLSTRIIRALRYFPLAKDIPHWLPGDFISSHGCKLIMERIRRFTPVF